MSTDAQYRDGTCVRIVAHRPSNPTRDKDLDFDTVPAAIHRAEFWSEVDPCTGEHVIYRQVYHGADGVERGPHGSPVPPRPAGVPIEAWFDAPEEQWKAGRWTASVNATGLQVFWDKVGTLIHVEYHRGGELVGAFGVRDHGSPLVEAARDGRTGAVDTLLSNGLGAAPGAAIHAAWEGLPTWPAA